MRTEDFPDVARVLGASRIAGASNRAVAMLHAAAATSATARLLERLRRSVTELSTIERVRLSGVLLLTIIITHTLFLRIEPPLVSPAVPSLLYGEVIAAGVVLVLAAPQIAHAWTSARVRRLLTSSEVREVGARPD